MVSDDLPSAWRLQSLLLRAGLVPRTIQSAEVGSLGEESAELIVFDRGVPGAVAIDVLGRVRAPTEDGVAPALFLSGGGGVATSAPGELRLDAGASDSEITAAVDRLMASAPRAEPRVIPAVEEIDIGSVVGSRPGVIGFRRRRSSLLGPLAALALLLGAIAGYSLLAASRQPEPTMTATPTLVPELVVQAVEHTATPASTATPRPIGGPVAEDSGAAPPRPPALATHPPALLAPPGLRPGPAGAAPLDPGPTPPVPATTVPTVAVPAAAAVTGLEGRVTDSSTGHALPGAVVVYRGPVEGQVTTGGDGHYRIPSLPPGAYEVVAVAPGYARASNRAGVVADTLTTDNLALAPMAGASVAPFHTVIDQRSGQPVAAYGYPVRPGDTLRAIAERAGTTVDEILALNRIDDADHLEPGRVLYLPASTFGQK